MATQKQKLARQRNWFKFSIGGIKIREEGSTEPELELVHHIKSNIKTLLENFNAESTKLGLNVKEYKI